MTDDIKRLALAHAMHLADIKATHCADVPTDDSVISTAKVFEQFLLGS